jgi:hypothetical protein
MVVVSLYSLLTGSMRRYPAGTATVQSSKSKLGCAMHPSAVAKIALFFLFIPRLVSCQIWNDYELGLDWNDDLLLDSKLDHILQGKLSILPFLQALLLTPFFTAQTIAHEQNLPIYRAEIPQVDNSFLIPNETDWFDRGSPSSVPILGMVVKLISRKTY